MKVFSNQDKMVNLIRSNYHLLPVLNRFGLKLGFKDKTVQEICKEKGLNTAFFLAIVNTFNNPEYFPEEELISFSPLLIVDYLKKTHKHYMEFSLPKMDQLLSNLVTECEGECEQLSVINSFYKRYKTELLKHINEEETIVFPYVIQLMNNPQQIEKSYSIRKFEKEHNDVEMEINDLKNLIIKYLEPVYDENTCNEFLIALFRFERDILDHARIEDKILVPQVLLLEKKTGR